MADVAVEGQRARSRGAARRLTVLVLTLGSLLAFPVAADAAGGTVDFGDAPDGAKAGYFTAPGVTGHFPSKLATPGPQHTALGELFLGAGVDGETDSAQVDKDPLDDGISASLSACRTSSVRAIINGSSLSAGLRTGAHTAYLNLWFDWNRDGDWADPSDGCRAEWAVQNLPVNMAALSAVPVQVLPVTLTAGKKTNDIWMRATLTLDHPVVSPLSRGGPAPYTRGETEDYLLGADRFGFPPYKPKKPKKKKKKKKKKPKTKKQKRLERKPFKVSCKPNPAIILHGSTATVRFTIADKGRGFIIGKILGRPGSGKTKLTPKKPQPKGVPPGFKAMSGFTHKDSQVDGPSRVVTKTVKFLFRRDGRAQRLNCVIKVVHIGNFLPPFICGGGCAGVLQLPPITPIPGPVLTGGNWTEVPTELVQLRLQSAPANVTEIKIPLLGQSPPWPDAELTNNNDPQLIQCELRTMELNGGPAAMVCSRNPSQLMNYDYFFDPFGAVPDIPSGTVRGVVTAGGTQNGFQVQYSP